MDQQRIKVTQQMMDDFLLSNFHKIRLEPNLGNIADIDYALRIERMFAEGVWEKVGEVRYKV